MQRYLFLIVAVAFLVFILIFSISSIFMIKKPRSGFALIKTGYGGLKIYLDKLAVIFPFVQSFEYVDITTKIIKVETNRTKFKDEKAVNIRVTFHIKLILTTYEIEKAINTYGVEKLNNPRFITQLFEPKLIEAIESVAIHLTYDKFISDSEHFKSQIFNFLGKEFNGFNIDDCIFELPK
jgi:uncharacterized membrane protein YqiK